MAGKKRELEAALKRKSARGTDKKQRDNQIIARSRKRPNKLNPTTMAHTIPQRDKDRDEKLFDWERILVGTLWRLNGTVREALCQVYKNDISNLTDEEFRDIEAEFTQDNLVNHYKNLTTATLINKQGIDSVAVGNEAVKNLVALGQSKINRYELMKYEGQPPEVLASLPNELTMHIKSHKNFYNKDTQRVELLEIHLYDLESVNDKLAKMALMALYLQDEKERLEQAQIRTEVPTFDVIHKPQISRQTAQISDKNEQDDTTPSKNTNVPDYGLKLNSMGLPVND